MHLTGTTYTQATRTRWVARAGLATAATVVLTVTALAAAAAPASAAEPAVELATAGSFAVLGGQSVSNTGPTVLNGDLGVSPGSAITGFPPGLVNGAVHATDAVASIAQGDLTNAYNDAAGRAPTSAAPSDLGGLTLTAGVYNASSSAQLTGNLTLDGENDPAATFIFQIGSTLTTASNSSITLINDAQACNVFWQVGSSATLGTSTTFIGTIMALTSVTLNTNAGLIGRALASNGSVTLDSNVITVPTCAPPPTSTPPTDTSTTPTTPTTSTPPTTTTPPPTTPSTPPVSTPPTVTTPPTVSTTLSSTARTATSVVQGTSSTATTSSSPTAAVAETETSTGRGVGVGGAGGSTPGSSPLAATGPHPVLPLLIAAGLLLGVGGLLLATARNQHRPRRQR